MLTAAFICGDFDLPALLNLQRKNSPTTGLQIAESILKLIS
jgi:hypothetical protein